MRIRLSKGNIEALHRAHEAGYDIVICTGRPLAGVRPIFEDWTSRGQLLYDYQ